MRDYAFYASARERFARRAGQDREMAARHAAFDLAAQDLHHKHDRPQFAVVGEGSRQAMDNYRDNYDLIRWRDA